jgi:hypothetical protein
MSLSSRSLILWLTDTQVYPEFDKLQQRTIFVEADAKSGPLILRPFVWVQDIKQPEDRQFLLVDGWPNWNAQQKTILENAQFKKKWAVHLSRPRK